MKQLLKKCRNAMRFSWRDTALTVFILAAAAALSFTLRMSDDSKYYASMIYVLGVFLIARMTDGYFYGIAGSLASVLLVNFLFTYPYFAFNFTLSGYPIAILSMSAVSVITSALTTQAKHSADVRLEVEREKTRSNLLRAVSHDLRTPLTGILGASSAILENDDTISKEERLGLLQDVCNDAQWLIRMVENLLTITRMDEQSAAKVVKIPEAAEEILETSVVKFRKLHPTWKVSVQVPEEFLMIPMDAVLIEQVLMNLLENVVDHSETADHIWIGLQKDGRRGVFYVRDNGRGIDTAVMPSLFNDRLSVNYGRAGDSKRNMGIGLSVCYTIIQAHNGVMNAKNTEEGGAEFSFALPLEEQRDE